jgi:hypothetical protein
MRCSGAREQVYLEENLRQLIFKSYRAIFWIDKKTVYILFVRHDKQLAVGEAHEI